MQLKLVGLNTIFQVVARLTSSLSGFFLLFLITSSYGVATYGIYTKITAAIGLCYLLVDLGCNAIFLQHGDKGVFRSLFYFRFLLAVCLIVVANAVLGFVPDSSSFVGHSSTFRWEFFLFSLTIMTESVLYSSVALFQKKLHYNHLTTATFVGSVMLLFGSFFVAIVHLPLTWLFAVTVVAAVIEAGVALFFTKETILPFSIDWVYIRDLLKQTFPLTLMLLFNLIYFRIDMIILSSYVSSSAVGIYAFSYKIFDFLIALPLFLSNSLYPAILDQEKNKRMHRQNVFNYVGGFIFLSLFLVIPLWFLSPFFVLVHPSLASAVVPFRILLVSLPVFFGTNILQWFLIAKKKQLLLAWVYGVLALINIAGNIVLIPEYGYIASAILTSVSETGVFAILLVIAYNTLS